MPEIHYTVRWPDASETVCYSPSLIVQDVLAAGHDYPLGEFVERVRGATAIANDRVRAKYGFACSRASDQLQDIEAQALRFDAASTVRLVGFAPIGVPPAASASTAASTAAATATTTAPAAATSAAPATPTFTESPR